MKLNPVGMFWKIIEFHKSYFTGVSNVMSQILANLQVYVNNVSQSLPLG